MFGNSRKIEALRLTFLSVAFEHNEKIVELSKKLDDSSAELSAMQKDFKKLEWKIENPPKLKVGDKVKNVVITFVEVLYNPMFTVFSKGEAFYWKYTGINVKTRQVETID